MYKDALFDATLFEGTLFDATLFEATLIEATLFEATLFEATLLKTLRSLIEGKRTLKKNKYPEHWALIKKLFILKVSLSMIFSNT